MENKSNISELLSKPLWQMTGEEYYELTQFALASSQNADRGSTPAGQKALGVHAFYKVLLTETDSGYDAIGFIMNNEAGHRPLTTYVKTVDEVEEITGLNFFSLLPKKVKRKVESEYNLSVWNL